MKAHGPPTKFGSDEDLKSLVADLHQRDMYIMVDIVVNNVMATTTTPDYSSYMFKDASLYHSYCPIQWGNSSSEQNCWLGDEKVPLPDLDTSNPTVISMYGEWIKALVAEYQLDGLRIDAAKHVNIDFWPRFCAKAGVFCIGEVFSGIEDIDTIAKYQSPSALDAILNFPMRAALVQAFAIPGPGNISALANALDETRKKLPDLTVLGNFLENQDVERWSNISVDVQSLYNAMVWTFMSDGIPIVYYGQEQFFAGASDPYNREPLWPSGYAATGAYNLTAKLNQLRNYIVNSTWLTSQTQILTVSKYGIAIIKGDVISVMTNIGSPPQNDTQISVQSPYDASTPLTDVLTCKQWVTGSNGYLDVEYTKGGRPVVLVLASKLVGSQICTDTLANTASVHGNGDLNGSLNGAGSIRDSMGSYLLALLSVLVLSARCW